jgi:hypothetical protein
MVNSLEETIGRYHQFFLYDSSKRQDDVLKRIETDLNTAELHSDVNELRESIRTSLGNAYVSGRDFVPHQPVFDVEDGLDILIIDQCSGSKYVPDGTPECDIDEVDEHTREELLSRENVPGIQSRDLYTGRQQEYIATAVRQLRDAGHNVERHFISAGFGLVSENEKLPPYEVTFSSMKVAEIRQRSADLHIQEDLWDVLAESDYDIAFFTLGSDYYTSIDIDETVRQIPPDKIGIVFNRDLVGDQYENIISVPARTEDAERHGTIVIGLKGLYLKNFAQNVTSTEKLDPEIIQRLCRYLEDSPEQAAIEKF